MASCLPDCKKRTTSPFPTCGTESPPLSEVWDRKVCSLIPPAAIHSPHRANYLTSSNPNPMYTHWFLSFDKYGCGTHYTPGTKDTDCSHLMTRHRTSPPRGSHGLPYLNRWGIQSHPLAYGHQTDHKAWILPEISTFYWRFSVLTARRTTWGASKKIPSAQVSPHSSLRVGPER